jgi:hypothetical protein
MLPTGRNQPTPDDRRSPTVSPPCDQAAFQETAKVGVCPTCLPRALRTLAHEAGYRGRTPPSGRAGSRHRHLRAIVVLAGRAIHLPQAAVTSGIQRTITVTHRGPLHCEPVPDLGGRSPKLHGMQEVTALIGLAVRGRPIQSLVAEDRSAAGVHDRTGRAAAWACENLLYDVLKIGPAAAACASRPRAGTTRRAAASRPHRACQVLPACHLTKQPTASFGPAIQIWRNDNRPG